MHPSSERITKLRERFRPGRDSAATVVAPLVLVGVAVVLRLSIEPFFKQIPLFFTFYLAVVFSAWYGGALSGILAWATGLLVGTFAFGTGTPSPASIFQLQLYFTTSSTVTILLFGHQRRAQAELVRYGDELEAALRSTEAANDDIQRLNMRLKEAMRETHHRVKNNLQVISALIDLRKLEPDPLAASDLERLNLHVLALATIHDVLTGASNANESLDSISAREGIGKVADLLSRVLPAVQIDAQIDEISLSNQRASSIAMLINELVSNSAKHGADRVVLRLQQRDGSAELVVEDNGPGFAQGFDSKVDGNTGLELVERLAEWDLAGTIQYSNAIPAGAQVLVRFPTHDGSRSPHPAGHLAGRWASPTAD